MNDNQSRWFVFLEKLETRMEELCIAAIPELQRAHAEDADVYKRSFGMMLAGVKGQLNSIREKAREVSEDKVGNFFSLHSSDMSPGDSGRNLLYAFRTACYDREREFEQKHGEWMQQLDQTASRDPEAEYRSIQDEYAALQDRFQCRQCGATIPIRKMFFITTYLACSHCQAQNTFEPSTQARRLEALGRELAEARTAHLLEASNAEKQRHHDLYTMIHENRVRSADSAHQARAREEQNAVWQQERQQAAVKSREMYEIYLRAMFDEWNKVVPDLAEYNEKFYQRMLSDFRRSA
jgi:RNA polymerase-binding transcription factor DksA